MFRGQIMNFNYVFTVALSIAFVIIVVRIYIEVANYIGSKIRELFYKNIL